MSGYKLNTVEKRNIFNEGYTLGIKAGKRQSNINNKKLNTMVTVYFKEGKKTTKVATFETEELYKECYPTLRVVAKGQGVEMSTFKTD